MSVIDIFSGAKVVNGVRVENEDAGYWLARLKSDKHVMVEWTERYAAVFIRREDRYKRIEISDEILDILGLADSVEPVSWDMWSDYETDIINLREALRKISALGGTPGDIADKADNYYLTRHRYATEN